MVFTYQSFETKEADSELWGQMNNYLNSLSTKRTDSAKIGTSDQRTKEARAVIISTDDKAPSIGSLGDAWSYQEFLSGSDYDKMYQECVDFLNDDTNRLTLTQKYYSRLTFTNASANDSKLLIWYRNMR